MSGPSTPVVGSEDQGRGVAPVPDAALSASGPSPAVSALRAPAANAGWSTHCNDVPQTPEDGGRRWVGIFEGEVTKSPYEGAVSGYIACGNEIAFVWGAGPERERRALLMAAAPELLAALEHILAGALSLPRFAEVEARAAIAKATGTVS